jgi:hypothetical protein
MIAPYVVVLDVNGVLLHREFNRCPLVPCMALGHVDADVIVNDNKFSIFLRPEAKEFILWLSERADVVIWSTMTRPMLEALIEVVFVDCKPPMLVLDQKYCTDTGICVPRQTKKLLIKEIEGIAQLRNRRVLIVDDAPYKVKMNPCDVICPVTWHPLTQRPEIDNALAEDGEIQKAVAAIVRGGTPVFTRGMWEIDDRLLDVIKGRASTNAK